jgi:hypothetical protein
MRYTTRLCVAILLLIPGAARAAAGAEWSAGAAVVDITPATPIPMAGYAARTKPFERVDHPISARALAVRDAAGSTAILLTLDICILPRDVVEPVRRRIAETHHLQPGAVLVSLSHTHSGPAVSLTGDDGAHNPVNPSSADIVAYARALQEKLAEVADRAVADLKPAVLAHVVGVASFAMNRREFTDKGVILGVNPRGPVDRSVPVLRVDDPTTGKPRAIVFGYACHGTTMPSSSLGLSADYPGYARDVIEAQFPGATALFVAGCGGDANPWPRQQPQLAALHGRALGQEVVRVATAAPPAEGVAPVKLLPVRGPLRVALETPDLPMTVLDKPALEELAASGAGTRKADAKTMLTALGRGEKLSANYRASVSAWQFGNDLTLIGLSNEVVVDYAHLISDAVGPLRLWVGAYCHEVEGYVPSRRVLREGGYETRGLYIGAGWFAPAAEDALVAATRSAASKAGRAVPPSDAGHEHQSNP